MGCCEGESVTNNQTDGQTDEQTDARDRIDCSVDLHASCCTQLAVKMMHTSWYYCCAAVIGVAAEELFVLLWWCRGAR